jgi:Ca2+-binding EF-hand superfamily protein
MFLSIVDATGKQQQSATETSNNDDPQLRTLEKNAESEFVSYDVDGNGKLDVADLRAKFKGSLKDAMLFKFMNDADKDKKGFLVLQDYIGHRKELLLKSKKISSTKNVD